LPRVFAADTWGGDTDGSRVKALWTGTMGFTADMLPLVGRVPSTLTGRDLSSACTNQAKSEDTEMPGPAEWISVGFNGSGMCLTWLCGVATGLMVLGREHVDSPEGVGRPKGKISDWFPEEFMCIKKRVDRSSIYQFAKLVA
jgi:glycine/D-amino acid oxidase-like deaminating enzyme